MGTFVYEAVNNQGELRKGSLEAGSHDEAILQIQALGLIPVNAREQTGTASTSLLRTELFSRKKLGRKDIAEFTRQLAILVEAGLALDRALDIILRVSGNSLMSELAAHLQTTIRGGDSLAKALQSRGELFSPFYISFIDAAEISGSLGKSLRDLSNYLEKSEALRQKLVSAMVYPAILVIVTVLSLIIILVFVLPEFSILFEDMDAELPGITAFVLGAGNFLTRYGLYFLAIAGLATVLVRNRLKQEGFRLRWDRQLLRIVVLGDLIRKIDTARLSRSLGTLLHGGVPILTAVNIAAATMGNRYLSFLMKPVSKSLQSGSGLAGPMIETGEFPEFAMQMVQVGEETGELDDIFLKLANIYDEEVAIASQRLLSIVEPLIIITLGVVIGGIIMSILVAMLALNELPI
jgi:general secretion pathway protein F